MFYVLRFNCCIAIWLRMYHRIHLLIHALPVSHNQLCADKYFTHGGRNAVNCLRWGQLVLQLYKIPNVLRRDKRDDTIVTCCESWWWFSVFYLLSLSHNSRYTFANDVFVFHKLWWNQFHKSLYQIQRHGLDQIDQTVCKFVVNVCLLLTSVI